MDRAVSEFLDFPSVRSGFVHGVLDLFAFAGNNHFIGFHPISTPISTLHHSFLPTLIVATVKLLLDTLFYKIIPSTSLTSSLLSLLCSRTRNSTYNYSGAHARSEIRLLSVVLRSSLGCFILEARMLEGFLGLISPCTRAVSFRTYGWSHKSVLNWRLKLGMLKWNFSCWLTS